MERIHEWAGRKDRYPVTIDAVIHRLDGTKTSVKLSDFSEQGCRIDAEHDFHIGERLAIAIARMGQVKAQVRWALPGRAGAKVLVESDF